MSLLRFAMDMTSIVVSASIKPKQDGEDPHNIIMQVRLANFCQKSHAAIPTH